MKFQITKEELLKAIHSTQNIITQKSTLPILSNILIDANEKEILFISTDLDIGVCYISDTQPQETGGITIPAKKFADIIKELQDGIIKIVGRKNNTITIEQETSFFKLNGMPKDEFPKFPQIKNKETVVLEQPVLKTLLNLTGFAVSYDETRYILNGILFELDQGVLKLVATDGKRLALVENSVDAPAGMSKKIIMPVKTIQELTRMLQDDGEIKMTFGDNQVLFEIASKTVVSRIIEGEFPNYQQVIPKANDNKVLFNRGKLLACLRRTSLFINPESQAVRMDILKNRIVISKSTPEVGECREELSVSYSGKEMSIGFNPHYIMDALKCLQQEELSLEITEPDKPAVIRVSTKESGKNNYIYLALPMRLG